MLSNNFEVLKPMLPLKSLFFLILFPVMGQIRSLNHLRNFPTQSLLLFRQARLPSLVLCVVLEMVMQRWDEEEQVIGKGEKLLL